MEGCGGAAHSVAGKVYSREWSAHLRFALPSIPPRHNSSSVTRCTLLSSQRVSVTNPTALVSSAVLPGLTTRRCTHRSKFINTRAVKM